MHVWKTTISFRLVNVYLQAYEHSESSLIYIFVLDWIFVCIDKIFSTAKLLLYWSTEYYDTKLILSSCRCWQAHTEHWRSHWNAEIYQLFHWSECMTIYSNQSVWIMLGIMQWDWAGSANLLVCISSCIEVTFAVHNAVLLLILIRYFFVGMFFTSLFFFLRFYSFTEVQNIMILFNLFYVHIEIDSSEKHIKLRKEQIFFFTDATSIVRGIMINSVGCKLVFIIEHILSSLCVVWFELEIF